MECPYIVRISDQQSMGSIDVATSRQLSPTLNPVVELWNE